MKKRLSLIPLIALLGVALPLASCNTNNPDEQQNIPSQPDDNDGDAEVKPMTAKLSADKFEIEVNETLLLNVAVANNKDNLEVKVTSNHPNIIEIVKVNGEIYAKGVALGYAKVTLSVGELTSSINLTCQKVYSKGNNSFNEINEIMETAKAYEASHLKAGEYHQSNQKGLSNPNTNDYTFNVYQDNKVKVEQSYRAAGTYFRDTTSYYGLANNSLVIYQYVSEDGNLELTNLTASYPFGEVSNGETITKADALKYTSGVDFDASGDPKKTGAIKDIFEYNISNYLKDVDKTTYVLKSVKEGVKTLTGHMQNVLHYKEFNLDFVINEDGALTSYKFKENVYGLINDPNNPGQKTKGEQTNTNIYSASFEYGEKDVAKDFINLDSLFFKNYDFCVIDSADTENLIPVTNAKTGQQLQLLLLGGAPTTATDLVDKIQIKSVSPINNAAISGNTIIPTEAGPLTITAVSLKGVEKQITINVEDSGGTVNTIESVMTCLTTSTYVRENRVQPGDKFTFTKVSDNTGTFSFTFGHDATLTGEFELNLDSDGISIRITSTGGDGVVRSIWPNWKGESQDFTKIQLIISYGTYSQVELNIVKK